MSFIRELAPFPERFLGNPLPVAMLGLRGQTLWAKPSPYPQTSPVIKTKEESVASLANIPQASSVDPVVVASPKVASTEVFASIEKHGEELTPYSVHWPMDRVVKSIEVGESYPILTTYHFGAHFHGWGPISASFTIKKRSRDGAPLDRTTRLVTPDRPIESFRRSPARARYNSEGSSSPEGSPYFSDQLAPGWSPNSSLHSSSDDEGDEGGDEHEAEKEGKAKRARHSPSPSPPSPVRRRSPRLAKLQRAV
ncbi:hypothetical protein BJ875DRAFT_441526 [Amylocarpus encephaloides]|uniref:Uncharacterized protein n=1 Tax=Amylocarpus encephaloides TaxID=45428 RepID=A0A9P7YJ81_9HELO|nr:hypothetical protein BJ875DRAFT_441526 [Amylocarpus encephaloides]